MRRVCNERELPGEGFSILTRTADNEHKAWRKRQICYRLGKFNARKVPRNEDKPFFIFKISFLKSIAAKRGSVTKAVTDVILCSKIKIAPDGNIVIPIKCRSK